MIVARLCARALSKSKYLLRLLALSGALLLSGCVSQDAPMNFLYPEGPQAIEADRLWDVTFAIAAVIFVIVEGALIFILIKYRESSSKAAPRQLHGHTRLEIIWTIIPTVLLTGIAFITVPVIFEQAQEPDDALQVEVVGHQWWWEVNYDNGVTTANEVHIPVDQPVFVSLKSIDVVHSFWVPKLAGKQDVVPGRVNTMTIQANEPGEYLGQCAEYCGLSHANMRFRIYAHEQADYERWVTEQQQPAEDDPVDPLVAEGRELFHTGQFADGQLCVACHAIDGTDAAGIVGPNLTHLASRSRFAGSMFELNEENLRAWLENPPGQKPGSLMPDLELSEEEIRALVAYLMSLD